MEAFPHLSTIRYFLENKTDEYPQSHVIDFHNKADGHERRLATYLVENLRMSNDLPVSIILYQEKSAYKNGIDSYLSHTSRAGRDDDVWLSGMASPMG